MCWVESNWVKDKDFTLTGGAANYSFIYVLFKVLDNLSPQNILELGLGQTTKLTSQYIKNKNNIAKLDVIEHSQEWIDVFAPQFNNIENCKIYHRELEPVFINNSESDKYKNLNEIIKENKYNLVIIDGPIGIKKDYPRTNILDLIPQNLAENFIIILDDAERKGEKNTANLIFEKLNSCNIEYIKSYKAGLKTQLIITSKNYNFIHWI